MRQTQRLQLQMNRKPRNPLVAVAKFRSAGAHGGSRKSRRQAAAAQLRMDLEALKAGP